MKERRKRRPELQNLYSSVRFRPAPLRSGPGAQGVVRRLIGSTDKSAGRTPTEPDVARFTHALDEVQRRLGELEERMDFAERLLAKERVADRLSPPHG